MAAIYRVGGCSKLGYWNAHPPARAHAAAQNAPSSLIFSFAKQATSKRVPRTKRTRAIRTPHIYIH